MLTPEELETLKDLYQELADHTKPICATECARPFSCCAAEYCEFSLKYAQDEYGITLQRTTHPTLPMMGDIGCTVPAYLRPICTSHACTVMSGLPDARVEWSNKYWNIRGQIEELEWKRRTK